MVYTREIVTLHVGQAGVQLGNAVWETMIAEHAVNVDGSSTDETCGVGTSSFFHENPSGRQVPRALFIDTEPTVVDEIRTGFYRQLFHPEFLVTGTEDASNNFARGYYTIGKKMLYQILEKFRYIIESCNNFKGFMSYSGSGGGTGSGLYSLLIERSMLEYTGKTLFGTLILAGKTLNDSIVDPYNSILRLSHSAASDLNLLIDNESMYKICYNKLEILRPTYTNLNRLASPVLSTVTAPFRFQGPLRTDLSEISTNLIPFPRINFPTVCYAPFMTKESINHSFLNSSQLLYNVFKQENNLLGINLHKGKLMSSVLTFRGLHQMNSIIEDLNNMKNSHIYEWVDWCPTGFKITQSLYPAIHNFDGQSQSSILMMCNHSEVTDAIKKLCEKFSILYSKRSFVHWFVKEGMEMEEMNESIVNMQFLIKDYEEVCMTFNKENTQNNLHLSRSSSRDKNTVKNKSKESVKNKDNESMKSKSTDIKRKSNLFQKTNSEENLNSRSLSANSGSKRVSSVNKSQSIQYSQGKYNVPYKKPSDEYQMNPKARQIILQNVTTLSPETKQRMFGNID